MNKVLLPCYKIQGTVELKTHSRCCSPPSLWSSLFLDIHGAQASRPSIQVLVGAARRKANSPITQLQIENISNRMGRYRVSLLLLLFSQCLASSACPEKKCPPGSQIKASCHLFIRISGSKQAQQGGVQLNFPKCALCLLIQMHFIGQEQFG